MAQRSKQSQSKRTSRRNGQPSSRRGRSREEIPDYSILDPEEIPEGPDVLLDIPVVKVDEIDIEVDDLRVQVSVLAEVRDLVEISVGADVALGKVELKIEGVEAQALLKARLDNVSRILERVLTSLDRNPELLESIGQAVEDVGQGAGGLVGQTGEAVQQVGQGASSAVQDVGQGASSAVQDVGQGAGEGVGQIGQGAQQGLAGIGQGAGQGVADIGQGAGQGVAGVGQGARELTENLAQSGQSSRQGGGK
jgi:phage-related protein